MFLKQIHELSKKAKVQMNISTDDDGLMEVFFFITVKSKGDTIVNLEPIVFNGKLEELEVEMTNIVGTILSQNNVHLEQLNRISKALKKAEKDTTSKATGRKASGGKSAKDKKAEEKKKAEAAQTDIFSEVAQVPEAEQIKNGNNKEEIKKVEVETVPVPEQKKEEAKIEFPENTSAPKQSFSEFQKQEQAKEDPNKKRNEARYAEMMKTGWTLKNEGKLFERNGVTITSKSICEMDDQAYKLATKEANTIKEVPIAPEIPIAPLELQKRDLEKEFNELILEVQKAGYSTDKMKFEDYNNPGSMDALKLQVDKILMES